jgi:hypothetical protein
MGYTFFRDGRVLPRHTVASEPALKRVSSFSVIDSGYDFITPRPGTSGAVPRLTLYSPDGRPDVTYFGPSYGRQPRTQAEAIQNAMGGESCEACKMAKEAFGFGDSCVSLDVPERGQIRFPSVRLATAFCPDCRRLFVSGGMTEARDPANPDLARLDMGLLGQYIDMAV